MAKKVYVGLSGGVDSSVAAALLKERGYDVTGIYMKNWSQDLPGFECPWKQDFNDAKRVAVQLDIPFKMYDFEKQYRQKVVDYMIEGYKRGLTPNPDIMCNQEIKFKLFYETAREQGADYVATGHYARVLNSLTESEIRFKSALNPLSGQGRLLRAVDDNKDQTYFLYRVQGEVLENTLFPLGSSTKPEVRKLAEKYGLITAKKKESMGICFVGKVGIKDFLLHELGPQPVGDIINQKGEVLGKHDGAIYYTIGQRHGLDIGIGLPHYVSGKDMDKNIVYVTSDINDKNLWSDKIKLTSTHWINESPRLGDKLQLRTRHRAPLIECEVTKVDGSEATLKLKDSIRAITPGQSAVLYDGEVCLGGGIII